MEDEVLSKADWNMAALDFRRLDMLLQSCDRNALDMVALNPQSILKCFAAYFHTYLNIRPYISHIRQKQLDNEFKIIRPKVYAYANDKELQGKIIPTDIIYKLEQIYGIMIECKCEHNLGIPRTKRLTGKQRVRKSMLSGF